MNVRSILCCAAALSLSAAAIADSRQGQPAAADQPAATDDALVIFSAGIDDLLVSEKDAVLLEALRMLQSRVAELPDEVPDFNAPAPVLQMVLEMLMSPMTFRAGVLPDVDPNEGPPFYASLVVESQDPQQARDRGETIYQMLVEAMGQVEGVEVEGQPDLKLIDAEGAALYVGSGTVGDRPAFIAALNTRDLETPAGALDHTGLPAGVTPVFMMNFDARPMQPLIEEGMRQGGPDAEMVRRQLELSGVLGENPLAMTMALGYSADFAHFALLYRNYMANENYQMLMSRTPLSEQDLALIPADATSAQISRSKLSAVGDYLTTLLQGMPEQGGFDLQRIFEQIEEETGIHPQRDFFAHLGELTGYYTSEHSGGGGLLSTVGFVEVANRQGLGETLDRMAEIFNQQVAGMARGYVKIQKRQLEGHEVTSLTFPGLPVPLEVSWAVSDRFLVAGATPQALIAALDHMGDPGRGLAANRNFQDAVRGMALNEAVGVNFMDTPRLISGGYGALSLATSALANAVQSPGEGDRAVGLVLPPYEEFSEGAKAAVAITTIEGDDIVFHAQADRSVLVNAAGVLGTMGGYSGIAAAAVAAGVLMPAVSQAREAAEDVKSAAQLRQIHMAAQLFAQEHDGAMPHSADELIQGGYVDGSLLWAPSGDQYWLDFEAMAETHHRRIVGYDRGAMNSVGGVAVLFGDGHVETIDSLQVEALMNEEPNAGVDFDLPW